MTSRPGGAAEGLNRADLVQALHRRARLCAAEHRGVVAMVAHGAIADETALEDTDVGLLIVVEDELATAGATDALTRRFRDLPIEIAARVEPRSAFRARLAAGDPEIAAVRDRSVILWGALPLDEGQAW